MSFKDFYLKENNNYNYVFGDEINSKDADYAYAMAKKYDISVLSDKDLYVILKENDIVVGALWTTFMSGEFSFDIVVNDKFQGRGIGNKLVDLAIQEYENSKEAFDDSIIRADVVNPKMEKILLSKGFKIESKQPGHTMMVRK